MWRERPDEAVFIGLKNWRSPRAANFFVDEAQARTTRNVLTAAVSKSHLEVRTMRRSVLSIIALAIGLFGCGSSSERSATVVNNSNSAVSFGLYDISSTYPLSAAADAPTNRPSEAAPRLENQSSKPTSITVIGGPDRSDNTTDIPARKVIRNAELDLESESPEQVQQAITTIAESAGGFVVESNQSSSDTQAAVRDIVNMTVRVSAEKFGLVLEEIRKAGGRIVTESVKGQDVTEEFIDVEARLRAKKALEAQVLDIMKRASSIDQAMNVQAQLADVRADIEKIEGRKRFLENQSALSTIKLRIQTPKVFAASSQGFGGRLSDSFESGLAVAFNFILGLITVVVAVLPFAIFIGLPGFFFFRYFWNRQTGPKSVSEIAREEIS
jgi:hypothetical protein